MSDESKISFLSEEYPINDSNSDLSKPRLSKTLNSCEKINENFENESKKETKNRVSLVSLSENKEDALLASSKNACGLKKISSLSSLRLKSHKIKETFDLLRCGSVGKSENLSFKQTPIDNQLNLFKFSFESKSSEKELSQFIGTSLLQSPFTIELTDTGAMSSTILMSASPYASLRQKNFKNSLEITVEKGNKPQADNLKPSQAASEDKRLSIENGSKIDEDEETSKKTENSNYIVLVAIDFGTTHSGYAYAYLNSPNEIHLMKRWSDGETRFSSFKVPTTLLMSPSGDFHSFGYQAIEFYNDLESGQSKEWSFFEKFKMSLHNSQV
jgi:hypothetical protein